MLLVADSFPVSRLENQCMHVCVQSCFSHVQLSATLWTIAHWAPLSMGFSRQEYWSGLPCPPPGDLPNAKTEPMSLISLALAGSATWEALEDWYWSWNLSWEISLQG